MKSAVAIGYAYWQDAAGDSYSVKVGGYDLRTVLRQVAIQAKALDAVGSEAMRREIGAQLERPIPRAWTSNRNYVLTDPATGEQVVREFYLRFDTAEVSS